MVHASLIVGLSRACCWRGAGGAPRRLVGTLLLLGVVSCSSGSERASEVRSSVAHDETPDITDVEYGDFIRGHNSFGLELFARTCEADANCVFSPTSAYLALSMVYAGASGAAAEELGTTLRSGQSAATHHAGSNRLMMDLQSRNHGSPADGADGRGVELHLADSLWVDHSLQVEQDFLATLSSQYDVGVHRQALLEDPKQGAQDINDWVSGATDGRITDLMGNRLDPDVAFVLVNALAFEGTWAGGSLEETASPVTFTCLDGHEVGVPFLRAQTGVYASTPAGQMTELAYDGGALRLKLFLPAEGTWDQARESILSGQLPIGDDELNSADVRLSFPAAELLPPTFDLTGNLQTMGLKAVFAPRGLLGIADDPSLVLSKVRQKALLRMDAKGTVATAATAASGTLMIGGPTQPVYLQLDRPFFLAIEDATGALLFIGQVVDPE